MNVFVISSCAILREGILTMISKHKEISIGFAGEKVEQARFPMRASKVDILLLDINDDNEEELKLATEISSGRGETKLMILDFYERDERLGKALTCGASGYVSGKLKQEDIINAMKDIYSGKKIFCLA